MIPCSVFPSFWQVEKAHNADLHCVDWNPHNDNLIITGYFLMLYFSALAICSGVVISQIFDGSLCFLTHEEMMNHIELFVDIMPPGQLIILFACLIVGI